MTDRTQPDSASTTGSTHIIRYALELGLLWIDGDGRDKVREALNALDALEAKLASIGAGGVQALSAAPSDIAKLRHLYANLKNGGVRDTAQAKRIADGLLAPIIERLEQAAPKAAPAKACVCGEPQASGTVHRVDGPCYVAAPQQEAQEPVAYVHVPHYTVEGKVRPVVSFEKYQQDYADGIYSTRIPLYTAPQPAPAAVAEQGPVVHDEELLEQMYWEFDGQRRRTGEERLAFKGKMRSYASEFRRRSDGKMTFAQSVSDDMMNLADRLGSEYDDVDPRAWKHLLVYAPKASPAATAATVPLSEQDERRAFEQDFMRSLPGENIKKKFGHYEDPRTRHRWDGWKARAALAAHGGKE